jgi:hypothetical protein
MNPILRFTIFIAIAFSLLSCQNNNSVLKHKIDSLQKENVYLRFQITARGQQPLLLDTLKIYSADHKVITTHSLTYFLENSNEFKGQTITMAIHYVDDVAGQTLKNKVNDIASFSTFDGLNNGIIKVRMRPNMFVPKIHYKELVFLSFLCKEGSLSEGNIAVKIGVGDSSVPEGVIMSAKENN